MCYFCFVLIEMFVKKMIFLKYCCVFAFCLCFFSNLHKEAESETVEVAIGCELSGVVVDGGGELEEACNKPRSGSGERGGELLRGVDGRELKNKFKRPPTANEGVGCSGWSEFVLVF